ncbi:MULTISPECIES: sugar ABC transporter permease [Microbacterium]|uniref:carbohydrate ABC transporter permease n=1 Tax=Microbacterium TaxID=33882 RepID=UPI00146BE97C|nr:MULTISPECIES: sugar ABC transporter permease [Microbacterium]
MATAAALSPATPKRRRASADKHGLALLTTPAIVWYGVFTIGPLIAMFVIATLEWSGLVAESEYVGAQNFVTMWADPVFWIAVRNTAIQLAVVLPILLVCSFMLGYYVSLKPRGHRLLRILLFTPALISVSARSMVFYAIFAPTGLFNLTLESIGLAELTRPWLATQETALATVMVVDLWGGIGFTAVLFGARLAGIGSDVFEAAQLDGAGHWRRMWGVAFPITRDYFGVILMLQFIWVLFSSAGSILLLTKGGPGNASTTISFLVYDLAFTQTRIGYSQAVGVVLFALGIVGVVIIRRLFRPAV